MSKFACNVWRRCDKIWAKRGSHMARFARRGYGASRSPELSLKAYRTPLTRYVLILACFLVSALATGAQDVNVHIEPKPPAPPKTAETKEDAGNPDASLKNHSKPGMAVDVNLVLVNVTVTDDWNRIVTGLDKENFAVLEGSEVQQVRHFSSEDAPISLGVIFDMSGSMNDKIMKAREAVIEFFKTANPQDEFFMITFNDRPELRADFTKSVEDIQGKLVYTVPQGSTAMLDAIYMGVSKMKDARNSKKALLIISDGGDNHSRYTENEIKSMVKEADVQIYSIGIFSLSPAQPEEIAGPALLTEISQVTGGRLFTISNPNELADVATKIGIELRNQYVLGYRPNNKVKDGHWRKIKVKLNPPKGLPHLNVYARTGYYAPSQ
ncbi:MAG: von Willebrand factor, type [Candidatus Angelobacter sp.]|nr:von Willebrand factor, type [Candidatus Angelobacter sp.]